MPRGVKMRNTSKLKCAVGLVQEMIVNVSEDGFGVCVWYAKHFFNISRHL